MGNYCFKTEENSLTNAMAITDGRCLVVAMATERWDEEAGLESIRLKCRNLKKKKLSKQIAPLLRVLLGTTEDNLTIMETGEDDLFAELPMSRLVSIDCSFAELSAVAIHFSLGSYMGISPSLPM
ncbi:hypothetical protein CEXT_139991 [Caerostris extrusa]|uniref:Uncharacterized protein n=1 Tax=Caerostris extrusa TaxID=172846 RepID=A0AAV4TJ76_CAEEX|nr:hypothetical protein CEXT_139991 [Caerostris extrusa]